MKNLWNYLESIYVIVALIFCSGGVVNLILSGGINEGDTAVVQPDLVISRMIFLGIALIAAVLMTPYWKKLFYILLKEKWMLAIVLLALLSCLWSEFPGLSLRRGVGFVATMVFGAYFGMRFSLKQQLQLLAWSLAWAIALSLFFVILLPNYGITAGTHAGAWRGIFFTKNVLGKTMFFSTAVFWTLATTAPASDRGNRLWLWGGLASSIAMIVMSDSASAMVNAVMFIAIMTVVQNFRFRAESAVIALSLLLVFACLLTVIITINLESIFQLFGRDTTLTGRAELWPSVLLMIRQRFWLGYGYSGFWNGMEGASAFVWKATKWTPPDAHNGLLDTWLDLGLIGVLIVVRGYWNLLVDSFGALRSRRSTESIWMMGFLIFLVLANVTESSFLGSNSIFWIIYMGVAIAAVSLKQTQPAVNYQTVPSQQFRFKRTTPIFFNRDGGELDQFYQRWSENSPENFPTWRLWERGNRRRDE
jgi:exopolysaccharide production protein ExoQ